MRYFVSAALLVAGIIHLLPLPGVLGSERLGSLYGLSFSEPNLVLLMRHRAVLFGLLGAYLVVAAFKTTLQTSALIVGTASAASFLWLAKSTGDYNSHLARVVAADVVALACLIVGIVAHVYSRANRN